MLRDPALQEEVLRVVRDMQMTLHGLRTANPPHSTAKARVEHDGLEWIARHFLRQDIAFRSFDPGQLFAGREGRTKPALRKPLHKTLNKHLEGKS